MSASNAGQTEAPQLRGATAATVETKASQLHAALLQARLELVNSETDIRYQMIFTFGYNPHQFELTIPNPHACGREPWVWLQNPEAYGQKQVLSSDGDFFITVSRSKSQVELSIIYYKGHLCTQSFHPSDCANAFRDALRLLDRTATAEEWREAAEEANQ